MKNKSVTVRRAVQVAAVIAVAAVTVVMCIYMMRLYDKNNMQSFEELVQSLGIKGVLFVFAIQVVQVVLAVIPGEPIELICGFLYGPWGGLVLCTAGVTLGTVLIYLGVSRFGKGFVEKIMDSDKFKKLKFLKDPAKRDVLMFILLFIPGTPKDLLTYFAPFTGIPLGRLLVISAVARIPSIVTSTYVGGNVAEGNYLKSVIVFAAVGAVSLAGILIYNRIIADKNKTPSEDKTKNDK